MSAWPEAIYTIKKITADLLVKHTAVMTSMSSMNTRFNTVDTTLNNSFNALNTKIDNKFNTLDNIITLKQYVIASTTSGLGSTGFVSGAICFINEE